MDAAHGDDHDGTSPSDPAMLDAEPIHLDGPRHAVPRGPDVKISEAKFARERAQMLAHIEGLEDMCRSLQDAANSETKAPAADTTPLPRAHAGRAANPAALERGSRAAIVAQLTGGGIFLKHNAGRGCGVRYMWVTADLDHLVVRTVGSSTSSRPKTYEISDLIDVIGSDKNQTAFTNKSAVHRSQSKSR